MAQKRFGRWLKEQRQLKGVTQAQLEEAATISHSHLSKIENGRIAMPAKETRDRIHHVLGTSDEDLVDLGMLRKSLVGDVGGEHRTIYWPVEDDPAEWRLVSATDANDPEVVKRLTEKIGRADLTKPGRVETIEGILDLWLRADGQAERQR